MANSLPYMVAPGLITKILEKLVEARRPDKFTQDFLETKLGFGGGSAKPMIPLLKRLGFLASDGTPLEAYDKFRNSVTQGAAMAAAIKNAYQLLHDINEYAHELASDKLAALVTQVTGAEKDAKTTQCTVATFNNLKKYADFENKKPLPTAAPPLKDVGVSSKRVESRNNSNVDLRLAYTINLNLPESTNPDVFSAIFKALKEHLLTEV